MKGLKVNFNDTPVLIGLASEAHSITFILSYKKKNNGEMCTINITGTDLEANKQYTWLAAGIESPSKVVIELGEFGNEKRTEPLEIVSKQGDFILEQKMKTYQHLKKELETKGLI
jgi:hypothetical protein